MTNTQIDQYQFKAVLFNGSESQGLSTEDLKCSVYMIKNQGVGTVLPNSVLFPE